MKSTKRILLTSIVSIISVFILFVICYASYILLSYYRIEDNIKLDVTQKSELFEIQVDTEYSISTYNIGFGAYSQDYTFFLDSGYNPDGSVVTGYYSKAKSKDEVLFNTNGAIELINNLSPDFMLFQEVDTNSTRSYHVNQYKLITEKFKNYDSTFALNFHTAFLPYPLYDMHGKVEAGLTTLSKYQIKSAVRKSFTVATDLSKLFDLDRAFSVNEVKVANGNSLLLVNVHMSAYDKGGVIRKAQRAELNNFLEEANKKGYYVVVGGDFNHDLLTYNPSYSYDYGENKVFKSYISQLKPDWLQQFFNEDGSVELTKGYNVVASDNAPTCRDASAKWEFGYSYVSTIDGFIVSDNIEVIMSETVITKNGNLNCDHFAYSDHDPVFMKFKLKG